MRILLPFGILVSILLIFTIWIVFMPEENENHKLNHIANENLWVIDSLKNNENVNLSGLDLSGLDLSGLDLSNQKFYGAILQRTDLSRA